MNTQQDSPYTQNTICIQLCCLSGYPLWQVSIPKYLLSYPLQTPNCTHTPIQPLRYPISPPNTPLAHTVRTVLADFAVCD